MAKFIFCIVLGAIIGIVICIIIACISLEGKIDHEEENKKTSL